MSICDCIRARHTTLELSPCVAVVCCTGMAAQGGPRAARDGHGARGSRVLRFIQSLTSFNTWPIDSRAL
jgi:hypothetical protein